MTSKEELAQPLVRVVRQAVITQRSERMVLVTTDVKRIVRIGQLPEWDSILKHVQ